MVIGVRVAGRPARPLGLDSPDREQRRAEVAHALTQAVQCGLVDDRTLEADLVLSGRVLIVVWCAHGPPFARCPSGCPSAVVANVRWSDLTTAADVVRGHHHMW
jgi:hypothetical protein